MRLGKGAGKAAGRGRVRDGATVHWWFVILGKATEGNRTLSMVDRSAHCLGTAPEDALFTRSCGERRWQSYTRDHGSARRHKLTVSTIYVITTMDGASSTIGIKAER
jgi:hypothetical protein